MNATQTLTEQLIACRSISPADGGCQPLLTARLSELGFSVETFDRGAVRNCWLRRGQQQPLLCFAGHTDVVPAGAIGWDSDPFVATVRGQQLVGRGTADMKGALAAFVTAISAFVALHPEPCGSIAVLLTSDEEGKAIEGTRWVVEQLAARGERIQFCIVGEPTSEHQLGDTIKHGRRGSLSGLLTVFGKQGHIAYPTRARNPIHLVAAALAELAATRWDGGDAHFSETTWQASSIGADEGATNVTPAVLKLRFNFRFSPVQTEETLRQRVHSILDQHKLDYTIDWHLSGLPFLTPPGRLTDALISAIAAETGIQATLSTSGGTSDARFLAAICDEIAEFGPVNATIHQPNECIDLAALPALSHIYDRVLQTLLLGNA